MNKQQILLTAAMAAGVLAVAPLQASAEDTAPAATTTVAAAATTAAETTTAPAETTTTQSETTTTSAVTTTTSAVTTTTAAATTTSAEAAGASEKTKTETSYLTASKQITKDADGKAYSMDGGKKRTGRFTLSPNFALGDIDGDKSSDASDATCILIAAVKNATDSGKKGEETLYGLYKDHLADTTHALAAADINEDGSIDAEDATLILIYAAKAGATVGEKPLGTYEYWADSDGNLQTGFIKDEATGKTYYADADYRLATSAFEADGKKYQIDKDGSVIPVTSGWKTVDGKKYYYLEDGTLPAKGWTTIEGKQYYVNADGSVATEMWAETDKGMSYFDADGVVQKGWIKLADGTYYSDADGVRMTKQVAIDGKAYYFDPATGKMQTGWVTLDDGVIHYYNEAGVLQAGWLEVDGKKYYLQPDGARVSGLKKIESYIYYFDPTTGAMQKGFVEVEGAVRYFSDETGRLQAGWLELDGTKYYLLSDGRRASGLQKVEDAYYYFDPATGKMQTGFVEMEGGVRYFNADGKLYAGWMSDADGSYYYFKSDGFRAAGPLVINEEGFLFDESTGKMNIGWGTYGGNTYFSNEYGRLVKAWRMIEGEQYYFKTDYTMATGWQEIGGYRYYFDTNGRMLTDTTVDGYYLSSDGHAVSEMLYYIQNQADAIIRTNGNSPDTLAKYVASTVNYTTHSRSRSPEDLPSIGYSYLAYYGMLGGTVTSEYVAAELDYLYRRAGLTSIIMYEQTSNGYHYWNQVKVGDAWYNYDATNGWYKKTDAEITKLGGYTSSPLTYISNDKIVYN